MAGHEEGPQPVARPSYWGANRSTGHDVDDIQTDLPRVKRIADRFHLEMPVLGTYMGVGDHQTVARG